MKFYVQRVKTELVCIEAKDRDTALEMAEANWDHPGWAEILDEDVEFEFCDHKGIPECWFR